MSFPASILATICAFAFTACAAPLALAPEKIQAATPDRRDYSRWGIPTALDARARDANYGFLPYPWDSPQKSTDFTPYTILMADFIEKGTDNYGTLKNVTDVPHTPNGPRVSGDGQPTGF